MIAITMKIRAMMPRITASTVRPNDLSADPLVELTIPPDSVFRKAVLPARGFAGSGAPRVSADEENLPSTGAAGAEEGTDDVLTEMLGRRLQHAPAVPPRDIVNERGEPRIIRKHENVQRSVPAGHLVHLGQGELDRLGRRRPVKPGPPVPLQVGRWLAVGHDQ